MHSARHGTSRSAAPTHATDAGAPVPSSTRSLAASLGEPNHLLTLLPDSDYAALLAQSRQVAFAVGEVLFEPGEPITHVYFPRSGEFSVVRTVGRTAQVEVATIGREGMVWLDAYHGAGTTPLRCFTQLPGAALSLAATDFRELAREGSALHAVMQGYVQSVVHQMAQTIACNRLHSVDQRCARWLLMTHDRANGDSFPLTHEFLATMLGVRRAGVTVAEGKLRRAGLIHYTRGRVTVVDREGLERAACECYLVDKGEYTRLLGEADDGPAEVSSRPAPLARSSAPTLGR